MITSAALSPKDCLSNRTLVGVINCLNDFTVDPSVYNASSYVEAQPSPEQVNDWTSLITSMLESDSNRCLISVPTTLSSIYVVASFIDASFSKEYCILVEITSFHDRYSKGWGVMVVPAMKRTISRTIHLSAPHPLADIDTPQQAAAMFVLSGAHSLLVSGRHRMAFDAPTDCVKPANPNTTYFKTDPAHDVNEPFNVANRAIRAWQNLHGGCPLKTCAYLQIHGKAASTCPSDTMFISSGLEFDPPYKETPQRNSIETDPISLLAVFPNFTAPLPSDDPDCSLTATENVFGRLINGVPEARVCKHAANASTATGEFIHIEQAIISRQSSNYEGWGEVIRRTFETSCQDGMREDEGTMFWLVMHLPIRHTFLPTLLRKVMAKRGKNRKHRRTSPEVPIIAAIPPPQTFHLPPEITFMIMRKLNEGPPDRTWHYLVNASLVCRDWRGPAQSLIFQSIYFHSNERCKRFRKLVENNPRLLSYVRHLSILENDLVSDFDTVVSDRNGKTMYGGWKAYLHLPEAMECIPKLPSSVRSLGVYISPWRDSTVDTVKQFTNIKKLKIKFVTTMLAWELQTAVQNFHNLTHLHLCGSFPLLGEEHLESRRKSMMDLLVLEEVEDCFDVMQVLVDGDLFDLSGLEYLGLQWSSPHRGQEEEFRALDMLFEKSGSSLKTLVVEFYNTDYHTSDMYLAHLTADPSSSSLRNLTALENLAFKKIFLGELGWDAIPFHLASQLAFMRAVIPSLGSSAVTNVSSPSTLKTLTFKIAVDDSHYGYMPISQEWMVGINKEDPDCNWRILDSALSNEERFPDFVVLQLAAVVLQDTAGMYYSQRTAQDMQLDELFSEIKKCLPKLSEKKLILDYDDKLKGDEFFIDVEKKEEPILRPGRWPADFSESDSEDEDDEGLSAELPSAANSENGLANDEGVEDDVVEGEDGELDNLEGKSLDQ
ncbi:hypothetical protein D9758_011841 [Tetrapyrgos nigripes]|uniref:F-box domain-containing protein n=1 Tax=Tetrapyrgos nigripes TaxID=182062 RepID=A0A8H5FNM2_9AGAR|nr:hypothetical protein D9758_011841 [Tetrapyrgos nigripes]